MEKEYFITLMEIFMKESGLMTKQTAKAFIIIKIMELSTKVNGKMIYKKGLG